MIGMNVETLPAASGPLLRMEDVSKTYDTGVITVEALRGIDLEV